MDVPNIKKHYTEKQYTTAQHSTLHSLVMRPDTDCVVGGIDR